MLNVICRYSIVIYCVIFSIGCNHQDTNPPYTQKNDDTTKPQTAPQIFTPQIVAEYPHDSLTYTQGLFFHGGSLYESSGLYGQSFFGQIDTNSWKYSRRFPIEAQYFAEGSIILDNKLYVLTYQEHTCFVYDPLTFKAISAFGYDGEGWGLTTDGKHLIMSNGSNIIQFRNPENFAVISTIAIHDGQKSIDRINELEWIEGDIWANIYQSDMIAIIDATSGAVKSWVDCSELRKKTKGKSQAEVLNGIAYHPTTKNVYLTGKYWGSVFAIQLPQM